MGDHPDRWHAFKELFSTGQVTEERPYQECQHGYLRVGGGKLESWGVKYKPETYDESTVTDRTRIGDEHSGEAGTLTLIYCARDKIKKTSESDILSIRSDRIRPVAGGRRGEKRRGDTSPGP